jgi:hypothetical protein
MTRAPSGQSGALIRQLLSGTAVDRDAAAARLAILGSAAVRGLVQSLDGADADAQVRILSLLEQIGDPAGLRAAKGLVAHARPDVAQAAVGAVAVHLGARRVALATEALDVLTTVALDRARPAPVRAAAADVLLRMDHEIAAPLELQLAEDSSPELRRLAQRRRSADGRESPRAAGVAALSRAAGGTLPDDPDTLRRLVAEAGASMPVTTLHQILVAVRETEARQPDPHERAPWAAVRGAIHQVLAAKGSRLGVYDLRETLLERSADMPVGFLAALAEVGDSSCLEALAAAWTATPDSWFRQQLQQAFRAIVNRERITRRHAAARRLTLHHPDASQALWAR